MVQAQRRATEFLYRTKDNDWRPTEEDSYETKTLSIVEDSCLKYMCSICRNVLVKVQRALKHLEDADKEYCTRLHSRQVCSHHYPVSHNLHQL